jgi:hypothetical protein
MAMYDKIAHAFAFRQINPRRQSCHLDQHVVDELSAAAGWHLFYADPFD